MKFQNNNVRTILEKKNNLKKELKELQENLVRDNISLVLTELQDNLKVYLFSLSPDILSVDISFGNFYDDSSVCEFNKYISYKFNCNNIPKKDLIKLNGLIYMDIENMTIEFECEDLKRNSFMTELNYYFKNINMKKLKLVNDYIVDFTIFMKEVYDMPDYDYTEESNTYRLTSYIDGYEYVNK
jgi:hypothetical protein